MHLDLHHQVGKQEILARSFRMRELSCRSSPAVFSAVWPMLRVPAAPCLAAIAAHHGPRRTGAELTATPNRSWQSSWPSITRLDPWRHWRAETAPRRRPARCPHRALSGGRRLRHLPKQGCSGGARLASLCRCLDVMRPTVGPASAAVASLAIGESGGEAPLAEAVLGTPAIEVQEKPKLSQATLIWRAAKLPIYTVGLIPLTVAAAAAYLKTGIFQATRYCNDAHDAETGVDKDKPESVVNMTGSQPLVLGAAYLCLVAGVWGISVGAASTGDLRVAWLLAAAITCGYVYQCPPFRLSYKGLGEPLCFLSFGPLATTAFYLYQASLGRTQAPVTPEILGVSVLVGITTTLILFCSHFHQIEGDLQVGKMSPLVRIGTAKGAQVATAGVFSLYIITAALVLFKLLPPNCLVGAIVTLPLGKLVVDFVSKNHMYYCVRLHVAFGFMLALSLTSTISFPIRPFWSSGVRARLDFCERHMMNKGKDSIKRCLWPTMYVSIWSCRMQMLTPT
eukprot:SM000033S12322  [mRNA]  locus=s33:156129:161198:+ [translate_table: standard]